MYTSLSLLLKFRLSLSVSISSLFGYFFAQGYISLGSSWLLFFGGLLVTFASGIFNQILEKDTDAKMKRTQNRPIPLGIISPLSAGVMACVLLVIGFWILYKHLNPLTAYLSLASMILYSFIYTPIKKVGSVAVTVGAIPGALPPLIGWVAYTGSITLGAILIFILQFTWQYPHFWAIAWIADKDYQNAGFRLLPSKSGKGKHSAMYIFLYTLLMLPATHMIYHYDFMSSTSYSLISILNLFLIWKTIQLYQRGSDTSAKQLLISSLVYLPLMQLCLLIAR